MYLAQVFIQQAFNLDVEQNFKPTSILYRPLIRHCFNAADLLAMPSDFFETSYVLQF